MRGCTVVQESEAGRVALRFHGDFGRESAVELWERVTALKGEVLLDFSQVRNFDDLGVAVLARLLAENQVQLFALRGLRRHQLRILRYIGIEVEESTGAAHPVVHHSFPPGDLGI